jgi:hypothetical protein
MLHSITVYTLNGESMYEQHDMKTGNGIINSNFLAGFRTNLEEIF